MDNRRSRLSPGNLPTGIITLLTGALAFVAVVYIQGRSASPWALALVAAFFGAGTAMLISAAGPAKLGTPRLFCAAVSGAVSGLFVLVLHMSITNPGACAVAWAQMLMLGVPWVGGAGAAGSAALVGILRRQSNGLGPRGGDKAMAVMLLVAVVVCAIAVYPFARNALSFSSVMTGVSLQVQPIAGTQGSAAVLAGERILVVQPWGAGPVLIDTYDLLGRRTGQISLALPEEAGGLQMVLVDTVDGTPYTGWVQRLPPPQAQSGEQDVWQASLTKLDAGAGQVVRTWLFPAETTSARLGLVHMGHAIVVREGYITCYALPDQGDPVGLWRADVPGTDLMQAAAGTVVVATYGAPAACYEVKTGQRLWLVDGATAAQPVFDDRNEVWTVVTRDAVVGLKSDREGAVWGFGRDLHTLEGGAAMAMPHAGAGRLIIVERPSGPTWDWPPVNVRLTIYDTSNGHRLTQTVIERDAFGVISLAEDIVWVGGAHGLLIGLDKGGRPLFRTRRAGAVSDVVGSLDGGFLLIGQSGLQATTVCR